MKHGLTGRPAANLPYLHERDNDRPGFRGMSGVRSCSPRPRRSS